MAVGSDRTRKHKITIDNTKVIGSGSHTDIPVLITLDMLDDEVVDAGSNTAQNGGGDIQFSSDASGTNQLDLDVVSFVTNATPSSRECEMWVKVTSVSTSGDTDIYIWYNTPSASTQPAVTAPFGRNAAWSLAEVAVLMEDATPVDHAGNHTLSLAGSLTNIAGPFGRANSFAGDDRLSNTDAALRDILTTHDTTVSLITRKSAYVSQAPAISWDGTDDFIIYPFNDLPVPASSIRVFWRDVGGNQVLDATADKSNTWVHGSFTTRASNDHEYYENGTSFKTMSNTGSAGPFTTVFIGGWQATLEDFDGDIAQVVVWKTARTTGWITTEFNNRNAPATFATAGTPEEVGGVTTRRYSFSLTGVG